MTPVILWTDALLFLLLFGVGVMISLVRRHEHLCAPWRRVFRCKLGALSFLVLMAYVVVGVLDSLHFQPEGSGQIISAFDVVSGRLDQKMEKTYSAPRAAHLLSRELVEDEQGKAQRVYPPLEYEHLLGTDKIGQDVLYKTLKSIRTGLLIGTLTTLIMLPLAIVLGLMAGYFRGWVDDAIQYLYTTLSSIPGVLLIAAAILTLQVMISNHPHWYETDAERADLRLLALCFILGVTSWTGLCRLIRAETLKLRELGYVQAAQVFGVSHVSIISRHIFPNLMHLILISIALDFSALVLAEAVLSYVGVGVDPSMHSWGNMINSARLELAREPVVWWSLTAAFSFMFVLVLAANLFADAVRDAFDPKGQSL